MFAFRGNHPPMKSSKWQHEWHILPVYGLVGVWHTLLVQVVGVPCSVPSKSLQTNVAMAHLIPFVERMERFVLLYYYPMVVRPTRIVLWQFCRPDINIKRRHLLS